MPKLTVGTEPTLIHTSTRNPARVEFRIDPAGDEADVIYFSFRPDVTAGTDAETDGLPLLFGETGNAPGVTRDRSLYAVAAAPTDIYYEAFPTQS